MSLKTVSLKTVNLNLLPVLRALLQLRSVSAAARTLGRSPSAVSEALSQLRATLADPLLVRTQGRMVLTPRALELTDAVELACVQLEGLFASSSFDPRLSERSFVVAAPDYQILAFGPLLVASFHAAAPRLTLRFVDLGRDLSQQLATRDVDFALIPDFLLGDLVLGRLRQEPLFEDRTMVMMRAGHPLAALSVVDREALARHEQIAFHPNWETVDSRKTIVAFRRHLPIRAHLPQMIQLPFFLAGTDYIALVPARLAERMARTTGLLHRPLAVDEKPVRTVLAWSPVQDADPTHHWFRTRLAATLGALTASEFPNTH